MVSNTEKDRMNKIEIQLYSKNRWKRAEENYHVKTWLDLKKAREGITYQKRTGSHNNLSS